MLNVKLYFFFNARKILKKKNHRHYKLYIHKGRQKLLQKKKTFFYLRIYIYIGALIYTMNTDNQSNDKINAICVVEEFAVFKRH